MSLSLESGLINQQTQQSQHTGPLSLIRSRLQLQFAARMQGARDASAGSEAMRAHCHANRKEKRRCRGSDSRKKPKNQARCALPLGLLVPHLGCPAAARHDAGNEHVGGEEGEDGRQDGRAED